ncbi:MAG TPA: hypothetical protein VNZ57_12500 [Longimicrobiales bacterium]|nr:hypothetical protein [Longimicrobiales bacterium]
MNTTPVRHALPLLAIMTVLTGCGTKHRLDQYDFAGRTVAMMPISAPAPELVTRSFPSGGDGVIGAVIAAGSQLAVELEAREARSRLNSAAAEVDIVGIITDRTLQRTSAYLAARTISEPTEADFLFDLVIRSIAIDVSGSNAALVLDSETVLLERATGREIWRARIRNREALTPSTGMTTGADVVTAIALSTITQDDFERMLEAAAAITANWIADRLRDDLQKVRERTSS